MTTTTVHALDTLRAAMVDAARARFTAYDSSDSKAIGGAELASETADRAYFAEYARCVSSVDIVDRSVAATHAEAHIDTLRSMREPA